MPRIATDDDARRQKFVWLGPVNSPWPFEAQGRSWVMALVICPPLISLAGIPTWALLSPITSTPAAVIITTKNHKVTKSVLLCARIML